MLETLPTKDLVKVSYRGLAAQEGSIDIDVLFPALTSFSSAFKRANQEINGDSVVLTASLKAPRSGSLEIPIELGVLVSNSEGLTTAGQLVAGQFFTDIKQIVDLVVWLFKITVWSRGRQPTTSSEKGDVVTLIDETPTERRVLKVPADANHLWQNREIRRDLLGAVTPLGQVADTIRIGREQGESVSIGNNQRAYFEVPQDFPRETRTIDRQSLNVVAPAFERGRVWRMREGKKATEWYHIKDETFLDGVDKGSLRFGKYDYLICTVQTIKTINIDSSMSYKRDILVVHDHVVQGQLDDMNTD